MAESYYGVGEADETRLPIPAAGLHYFGVSSIDQRFFIKSNGGTVYPDIGTGFDYDEKWDDVPLAIGSTWTSINLGVGYEDKIVTINIQSNSNNTTVGVRAVGSSLVRQRVVDNDSATFFVVQADSSGNIELYSSNPGQTDFTIDAILK